MSRTHRNQQLCIIKHFELGPEFFIMFCKRNLIPTNSCGVMLPMDVCYRINLLMYSKSSASEMFWIFVVAVIVMLVCAGDLGTEAYYGEQNDDVMLYFYIYVVSNLIQGTLRLRFLLTFLNFQVPHLAYQLMQK